MITARSEDDISDRLENLLTEARAVCSNATHEQYVRWLAVFDKLKLRFRLVARGYADHHAALRVVDFPDLEIFPRPTMVTTGAGAGNNSTTDAANSTVLPDGATFTTAGPPATTAPPAPQPPAMETDNNGAVKSPPDQEIYKRAKLAYENLVGELNNVTTTGPPNQGSVVRLTVLGKAAARSLVKLTAMRQHPWADADMETVDDMVELLNVSLAVVAASCTPPPHSTRVTSTPFPYSPIPPPTPHPSVPTGANAPPAPPAPPPAPLGNSFMTWDEGRTMVDQANAAMGSEDFNKTYWKVKNYDNIAMFSGGYVAYLSWRPHMMRTLLEDKRDHMSRFASMCSRLSGGALKHLENIRSLDSKCCEEAFIALDRAYIQKDVVKADLKDSFRKLALPDITDPAALFKLAGAARSTCRSLAEMGSPIEVDESFADAIRAKIPLVIHQKWQDFNRGNANADRSVHALIEYVEAYGNDLMLICRETRQIASASSRPAAPQKPATSGGQGGGGKPPVQGQAATTYSGAVKTPVAPTPPPAPGAPPAQRKPKEPSEKPSVAHHWEADPEYKAPDSCRACKAVPFHEVEDCPLFKAADPTNRLYLCRFRSIHPTCLRKHAKKYPCYLTNAQKPCGVDGCRGWHRPMLHGGVNPEGDAKPWLAKGWLPNLASRLNHPLPVLQPRVADGQQASARGNQLRVQRVTVRLTEGGREEEAVALFDSGCSSTFIDERLARRLGLEFEPEEGILNGVHGPAPENMAPVSFEIRGKHQDGGFHEVMDALTRPKIHLSGGKVQLKDWALRHPAFSSIAPFIDNVDYGEVKIYLGQPAENLILPLLGKEEHIISNDGLVRAYETELGWSISGPAEVLGAHAYVSIVEEPVEPDDAGAALASEFRSFNELEAIGIIERKERLSPKEVRELAILESTAVRLPSGRIEVPLLVRRATPLPHSESQARKRLVTILKSFDKDPVFAQRYIGGIEQDEAAGYIRRLSPEDADVLRGGDHWFLPHFPVSHPDKPEKVRRVLDAAAKNNGVSLNSALSPGPNILQSLFGILLRFRQGAVAVNADIKDHFSQVVVPERQQPLLAFLWAPDLETEPAVYVNTRHVFGATCSPAIAVFALTKAAEADPRLADVISRSFYMDDFYLSGSTKDEVLQTASRVESTLKGSGFELGKWMSNDATVIEHWPVASRANALKIFGPEIQGPLPTVKALGVAWDARLDTFTFHCRKQEAPITTVASVLSVLASVFDPLGIVGPYVLAGKQIFQAMWLQAAPNWRAKAPKDLCVPWAAWMEGIPKVAALRVPRWYGFAPRTELTLHMFADASTVGYGAVGYLAAGGSSAFVAAKTRVVPPKRSGNMPRLELQASLLGTRLLRTLLAELHDLNVTNAVLWSDSQTTLHWLLNDDVRHDTFVNNRVADIQEMIAAMRVPTVVRYVPTLDNPADLASRGSTADEFLVQFQFWSEGPTFIRQPVADWPTNLVPKQSSEASALSDQIDLAHVAQIGTLRKRTPLIDSLGDDYTAFLIEKSGFDIPTASILKETEVDILRAAQLECFPADIQACAASPTKSVVRRVGPFRHRQVFLDRDGLLRLQTRAVDVPDRPPEAAVPIVLPRNHAVTTLIIRDAHVHGVEHQGTNSTHAEVMQRFHIPKGRPVVIRVLLHCEYCHSRRPRPVQPPMGPLHDTRLQVRKPAWTNVGMDHFGPFVMNKKSKKWGLIFICLTTRAIHLEDVDGPGAEPFCQALERFIGRRSRPEKLSSDRGTAFVNLAEQSRKTAAAYATELETAALSRFSIELSFNPPGTPHWGGSWERMIREIKKIVKSAHDRVGNWRQNDFRTFLVRAEAILNRRPIAFGPDGEILTPAMLITPGAEIGIYPPFGAPTFAGLERVKRAETHLWDLWVRYYLPSISAKQIFGKALVDVILPGDWVLLKEGSNPLVSTWTKAKVLETYKSDKDDNIRSALVEVNGKKLLRDITRISILHGPVLERRKAISVPSGGVCGIAPQDVTVTTGALGDAPPPQGGNPQLDADAPGCTAGPVSEAATTAPSDPVAEDSSTDSDAARSDAAAATEGDETAPESAAEPGEESAQDSDDTPDQGWHLVMKPKITRRLAAAGLSGGNHVTDHVSLLPVVGAVRASPTRRRGRPRKGEPITALQIPAGQAPPTPSGGRPGLRSETRARAQSAAVPGGSNT